MTGFSLKDQLFNREKVAYLADLFADQCDTFNKRRFVNHVMKRLTSLELKQRILWITEVLTEHLDQHFPGAVEQIVRSLPEPLDPSKTDDDFGDFIFAPLGEFVVRRGLTREHLQLSLATLKEITQRFSMEDAMRAFIRQFPTETLEELSSWTRDNNYHVRRLVSESTRPALPWSGRINLPVERMLPLLEPLHADPTRYVTRSVANHLNDIAKTQPELVVSTLRRWHKQVRQRPDELMWMTRHALRTLVKKGHLEALDLLGYRAKPKLSIGKLRINQRAIKAGDTLEFTVEITALQDESLVIDYTIDFVKAGGKRSSKVFKAAKLNLKKGESQTICKRHKLHAKATTYRLYPGEHHLTVHVNGQAVASASFELQ